jgi:hypothetical protein
MHITTAIETEMAKFLEVIALDASFDEFDFVANKSESAESENEIMLRSEIKRLKLVIKRIKSGKEKIYTSQQVRKNLGL